MPELFHNTPGALADVVVTSARAARFPPIMYKMLQGALGFVQANLSVDVMISTAALLSVFAIVGTAVAVPSRTGTAKRATCTVNSVSSASDLSDCSDVVIAAFTVPGGSRHFRLFLGVPLQEADLR